MTVYLSIPYRFAEADTLVQCAHCPDGAAAAGGYLPAHKAVVLCQQWVAKEPGEVENTIVHEMVSGRASLSLEYSHMRVCAHEKDGASGAALESSDTLVYRATHRFTRTTMLAPLSTGTI